MDVEKTIEFLLSQQGRTDAALAKIEAGLAKTEAGLAKTMAGLDKTMAGLARTDAILRRAVKLGVLEARAERKKRRELNEEWNQKMAQLCAAQLVTGESLNGLIQSLQRGSNGYN